MPMAPGYISLAYHIDIRMIKFYLLPICWQSMEEVAFRFYLQKPINLKLSVSFEFVTCKDLPLFLFDIIVIATNDKLLLKWISSHSPVLQQFCLLTGPPIAMVVLLPASSKVNLLNDDTYRLYSVTVIMSSF